MLFLKDFRNIKNNELTNLSELGAGFVTCKYGEVNDVADLKWLLVEERIDFTTIKLAFNGLNKNKCLESYN